MATLIKRGVLTAARNCGGFRVARRLTSGFLRVLCYHGLAMRDEHEFRPRLFVTADLFASRLEHLARSGFTVLGLQEALDALAGNRVPEGATVITFDDGFYGTSCHALPLLKAHSMPATIFMSTYYMGKGGLIFRLAVQYMFWKTSVNALALDGLSDGLAGSVRLDDERVGHNAAWRIIGVGEHHLDEPGRRRLLEELASRLGVDYAAMRASRALGLMSPAEVSAAAANGFDIQLHTHRHVFPNDARVARQELEENRRALDPLVRTPLRHFCYPSGVWSPEAVSYLEAAGIESACTCEAGLNTVLTPRLRLRRFLDGQNVSAIEFAAEMAGALELARRMRGRVPAARPAAGQAAIQRA
jgi:peptidoglycan/xylan/chitin deacetylase (PgdA/CDA1 family)